MTTSIDPVTDSQPKVIDRIAAFTPELVSIRHDIHQHPEIGFEEVREMIHDFNTNATVVPR